jgi:hypothetical protein
LNQNVEWRRSGWALLIETSCDTCAINRVDPIESRCDCPSLVCLDFADEMPSDRKIAKHVLFCGRFLGVTFSEMPKSIQIRSAYGFRRLPFADSHEHHIIGRASRGD